MQWLSESVEELIATIPESEPLDVLVIGSGYGGAVAALRFAEAGRGVTVLERGQEYVPGEFPNDFGQLGAHLRAEVVTEGGVSPMGYEGALFDLRVGHRAGALVGSGLGGTSLINAGVGLRADGEVFKQSAWPAVLRQENMARWYERSERTLELQEPTGDTATGRSILQSDKHQRLNDFARAAREAGMDARFRPVKIAVELRDPAPSWPAQRSTCIGCGDCVTGCNHGAKLSLTETYLPLARQHGARMFTGASVLRVEYQPERDHASPWVVTFVRTSERRLAHQTREAGNGNEAQGYEYQLRARCVVLAAGAFGSTEILLRSRHRGLGLSATALGMAVSGNADDLSFAYDMKQPVNGVGWGSGNGDGFVGPTITGAVEIRDGDALRERTLVQDGGVPGLGAGVFHELVTTLAGVAQLGSKARDRAGSGDPMALDPQARDRSMALLAMGHDSASGVIAYDASSDRVGWAWPQADEEAAPALHAERLAATEALGAVFVRNPATDVLPPNLSALLSGPKTGGALITVHPLGGCRMGDNHLTGVVDDRGAVFRGDGGGTYPGLYVMDGSIVPTSLGVNPLLTITALAERACHLILESELPTVTRQSALRQRSGPVLAPRQAPSLGTVLAEVLRGQALDAHGGPAMDAALFLRMPVKDWGELMRDPAHRIEAEPWAAASGYGASRLVLDSGGSPQEYRVEAGSTVHLFQADPPQGWLRRLVRTGRLFATYAINRWIPDLMKRHPLGARLWRRVLWKFLGQANARLAAEPWPDKARDAGFLRLALHRLRWSVARAWVDRFWPGRRSGASFQLASTFRLLWQATQVRRFSYRLKLVRQSDGQRFELEASKTVDAVPAPTALRRWLRAYRRGTWPAVARPSVWQQLTEADFVLKDASGHPLKHGRLRMDLPDVQRNLVSQIQPGGDSLKAILAQASYPLFMFRVLLQTRLLDFRAPDLKPGLPDTDPAMLPGAAPAGFELWRVKFPELQTPHGKVQPEEPVPLEVPLRAGSKETITIGLVRYRPRRGRPERRPAATWAKVRVKSIIMINGFAQNTHAFSAEELGDQSLASQLHADGWDIWMLEYRVSPLLRASAKFSSMDDIAQYDIPAAVRHVRSVVEKECDLPADSSQVFAFSHCVGSASLAMSILGGWLCTWDGGPRQRDRAVPHLAGVLFSQFQPFVVGSETAQQRLAVGSFLHNVLGREVLEFTAGTASPDLLHAMLDRLFASFSHGAQDPGQEEQCCPHEHDLWKRQPDSTTCKRMSGILSPLFEHAQLHTETHEKLDGYFGRTNLGVFLHGARCVEYERLVNANGQNVYATDKKIKRYFSMPIMLLHGEKNALFNQESLWRSAAQLSRAMRRDDRGPGPSWVEYLLAKDHAHFDCTIGKNAPTDIFPKVVGFFGSAWDQDVPAERRVVRCVARAPLTGPLIGWTRPSGTGGTLLRIWFEVDLGVAAEVVGGLTRHTYRIGGIRMPSVVRRWRVRRTPWLGDNRDSKDYVRGAMIAYCVADLELPAGADGEVEIEALGVYRFHRRPDPREAWDDRITRGLPSYWGVPIAPKHVAEEFGGGLSGIAPLGRLPVGLRPDTADTQADAAGAGAAPPPGGEIPTGGDFDPADDFADAGKALSEQAFEALWRTASAWCDTTRGTALRAQPSTLSRLRRSLRGIEEARLNWRVPVTTAGRLSFLAGACRHPGLTAAEENRADLSLAEAAGKVQPGDRFMLLLGDQVYVDARAGLLDSASPLERILPRYRQAFGSPGFRSLAGRLPFYMILDDHEIEDNWSEEHRSAASKDDKLIESATVAYRAFQRSHGPRFPSNGTHDAYFQHEEASFFMLDTRMQRSRNGQRRTLSERQWGDLESALSQAPADRVKFIVSGSVLAPGLVEGAGRHPSRQCDTWQFFQEDRRRLLAFILDKEIRHVVFLSSDYHCSAVAALRCGETLLAHAVCAPPLHAPNLFANTARHEILDEEVIDIGQGRNVDVRCVWSREGEGWLRVQLERAAPGWQLQLQFHLRDMLGADPAAYEVLGPGAVRV